MRGRALVLGGGGLLAHELVPALREAGWTVQGLNHGECDVTDPDRVASRLQEAAADLVFNCAGYTAVDRAEAEPDRAFAVNARGAGIVARACAGRGLPLVHLSTDFVFDGSSAIPYREEDPPCPLGVYARSKRAGEVEFLEAGGPGWLVRTGGLYGHHGTSFFRTILSRAARGEPLLVVDDQWTSPTWTRDLARQLVLLVDRAPQGVFHATSRGQTTWLGAARRALGIAGLRVPLQPVSTREYGAPAPRPEHPVLENAALVRLCLDRMRPWEEALAEWIPLAWSEWGAEGEAAGDHPEDGNRR